MEEEENAARRERMGRWPRMLQENGPGSKVQLAITTAQVGGLNRPKDLQGDLARMSQSLMTKRGCIRLMSPLLYTFLHSWESRRPSKRRNKGEILSR